MCYIIHVHVVLRNTCCQYTDLHQVEMRTLSFVSLLESEYNCGWLYFVVCALRQQSFWIQPPFINTELKTLHQNVKTFTAVHYWSRSNISFSKLWGRVVQCNTISPRRFVYGSGSYLQINLVMSPVRYFWRQRGLSKKNIPRSSSCPKIYFC